MIFTFIIEPLVAFRKLPSVSDVANVKNAKPGKSSLEYKGDTK